MIKTKTKKIFVLMLLVLIAVIGGFGFMLYQISYKIDSVKIHYAQSLQNKNTALGTTLKKQKAELASQEKIISDKFLAENELVEFITRLESMAIQNTLQIEIEKVEKGTVETIEEKYKTQTVTFVISLTGSVDQIQSYIENIKQQQEKISVKEFKLYKLTTGQMQYNARIILTANTLSI